MIIRLSDYRAGPLYYSAFSPQFVLVAGKYPKSEYVAYALYTFCAIPIPLKDLEIQDNQKETLLKMLSEI